MTTTNKKYGFFNADGTQNIRALRTAKTNKVNELTAVNKEITSHINNEKKYQDSYNAWRRSYLNAKKSSRKNPEGIANAEERMKFYEEFLRTTTSQRKSAEKKRDELIKNIDDLNRELDAQLKKEEKLANLPPGEAARIKKEEKETDARLLEQKKEAEAARRLKEKLALSGVKRTNLLIYSGIGLAVVAVVGIIFFKRKK